MKGGGLSLLNPNVCLQRHGMLAVFDIYCKDKLTAAVDAIDYLRMAVCSIAWQVQALQVPKQVKGVQGDKGGDRMKS